MAILGRSVIKDNEGLNYRPESLTGACLGRSRAYFGTDARFSLPFWRPNMVEAFFRASPRPADQGKGPDVRLGSGPSPASQVHSSPVIYGEL